MLDSAICSPFQYDNSLLVWLTHTTESGIVWYITSDVIRQEYQLWKGNKKTRYKSEIPTELYKYIKE